MTTKKTDWNSLLCQIPGYDPSPRTGDYYFDEEAAQRAIDFFPACLKHVKGEWAGKPLTLENWQKAIVGNLFGWKREDDGLRRYRTVFVYIPRKNSKSTMAAGLVLYLLFCDDEPGAEIYSAAAEREQASLVYDVAKGMVEQEPELAKRCTIYKAARRILLPDHSFYVPVSADSASKHGYNAHAVVVDELHTQPDGELVDVLETSMGARRQPVMMHLTTADYDRPSVCNKTLDYARKVRDGVLDDPTFLPVVYETLRDADDWTSEEVWARVNPNYGVSVKKEYLKQKYQKALDEPSFENTFKRLHLNMQTSTDVRFVSMEQWDKGAGAIDERMLRGKPCFTGIDLSSTTDTTAMVHVFPWDDGEFIIVPRIFVPKNNARKRERHDRVPYQAWADQGFLTMTDGDVVDYAYIRAQLHRDSEQFAIREIAVDRWNFEAVRQQLISEGIPEDKFVMFGQGFASMSAPTKELEKLIISVKIIHGGHPVMRWMMSNLVVETDAADNYKPSKKKSTERIDGPVALIMALGRAITQPITLTYDRAAVFI
jgi:phage terminase large subunit-like protein